MASRSALLYSIVIVSFWKNLLLPVSESLSPYNPSLARMKSPLFSVSPLTLMVNAHLTVVMSKVRRVSLKFIAMSVPVVEIDGIAAT